MRTASLLPSSLFFLVLAGGTAVLLQEVRTPASMAAPPVRRAIGATSSGPIAVAPDDRSVWVVNPDANSVTEIRLNGPNARVSARLQVGAEPQNLAISPDGKFVYVSNTVDGTVSVIHAAGRPRLVGEIAVGTEPYGLAFTPNGSKLYVANARSNNVSVIDPVTNRVLRTVGGVGLEPRGIAITNDGDQDDSDEKVYVTQFLGVDRPGITIGADDYKEGRVSVISTDNDQVVDQVVLNPMENTGFSSDGSALKRIAAGTPVVTAASPNMLNAIAIKGSRAYVPNTAASADGPVKFNVNVQALLSVIDTGTDEESSGQTINMNRGINFEPDGATKVFIGVPWQIAFKHNSNQGYAVAAAANLVVKIDLDASGTPTIHAPTQAGDPGAIVRIFVGQNPRGIAIDSQDERAFVMNEVSRDVSIIDLATDKVVQTVRTADLPAPGSEEATLLLGKAVFNSSTGVNLPELGPDAEIPLRLSNAGWSGCFSCHPFGHTDGIVWIFAAGPRRTLPLNGTFNPNDASDIKLLNHSAIRDEVQDFELNIRAVSGGKGLIQLANGDPDPAVANFTPPSSGRSVPLDALADYVAKDIRSPIAPPAALAAGLRGSPREVDSDVDDGRALFASANCQSCHGGAGWSVARRFYTPPPDPSLITRGQIISVLRPVGTFDPNAANEIRDNGQPPLGADGFVPPSLLGAFALAPYLHNGSAQTFADVLDNVTHRSAGTGGVDVLTSASDRAKVVAFLATIDASTEPFPIVAPNGSHRFDVAAGGVSLSNRPGLEPVHPNPAVGPATLFFTLPVATPVRLAIYDGQGRRLAVLVSGLQPAGRHQVVWNGRDARGIRAGAGVYFARLETAAAVQAEHFVLAQ